MFDFSWGQLQWGTVSAWIGTILTVGTLYMSLRLYRRDWHERHREQAKKVNVWIAGLHEQDSLVGVKVLNTSDSPVYELNVAIYVLCDIRPFYYTWGCTALTHAFAPGTEPEQWTLETEPLPDVAKNPPMSIPPVVATMSFMDTAGAEWKRAPDGKLLPFKRSRVERFLMNRYHMWPPAGKDDKRWVKLIGRFYFIDEILRYEPQTGWKFVRTPKDVKERQDREFAERYGAGADQETPSS